jgi:hypothetical protein
VVVRFMSHFFLFGCQRLSGLSTAYLAWLRRLDGWASGLRPSTICVCTAFANDTIDVEQSLFGADGTSSEADLDHRYPGYQSTRYWTTESHECVNDLFFGLPNSESDPALSCYDM